MIMGIPANATLLVKIFVAVGGHKQDWKCKYRFPDLLLPQLQLLVTKCYPNFYVPCYVSVWCCSCLCPGSWSRAQATPLSSRTVRHCVWLGLSCHKVPVFQSSNCTLTVSAFRVLCWAVFPPRGHKWHRAIAECWLKSLGTGSLLQGQDHPKPAVYPCLVCRPLCAARQHFAADRDL